MSLIPATRSRARIGSPSAIKERSRLDASPLRHFDFLLVIAQFAICAPGLAMIYSSTHRRIPGDELYFVKRQALFIVIGVATMVLVMLVDYRKLRDLSML